ncbi:MAG: RsmB/NOP family class I SAM-dependent RNA methyltransferase [Isosphaeraceae bacterium]|nr:RsmB/NOP family class I SAM-dependent RNA methyltransferase [Isosphaeraceae bacterium]
MARPLPKRSPGPPRDDRRTAPEREVLHVAPLDVLAQAAVDIAETTEHQVLGEHKRADRALALLLRERRDLAPPDHRFVSQSVFALFRWRGWVEPLRLARPEERLLLSWLFDSPVVHPVCRVWAQRAGRDASRLVPLGDAPNWTARAEGLKRWIGGRAVTADPWRLFPAWFREHLPLPPGGASPKAKYLEFLFSLQSRPSLWVRAQGEDAKALWAELTESGLKPWVHRRLDHAAKLNPDADVHHLPAFERGALEIQDVASQAVGLVCDPDPGDRWWDACAGAGGKALHLAALMRGKGVVVATDSHAGRLKETTRRARRSPFRNITTKAWDGKHVAGKPRSFDGVLVDAPCSAIGTWRRNPDARWTLDREAILRLAALQGQLLAAASAGVRPGGTLVYSVCTITPAETLNVVQTFLEAHPDFHLDPFVDPINESPTPGTLLIWPQDVDSDGMFVARMVRKA